MACTAALAALPLVRADGGVRDAGVRIAPVALLVLAAGIVRGLPLLVPVALVVVGGIYAAQLAVDDAPLDLAAPVFAAGLLVTAELAYWSIEERERVRGEPGDDLRRLALVAGMGAVALLGSTVLLAVADTVRARGIGVDVAGAAAASLVLLAVLYIARPRPQEGAGEAKD